MTDRERWTVYPLLFLSLAIGVKDKLMQQIHVENIVCKNLQIESQAGKAAVQIGTQTSGSGVVELVGAGGRPLVAITADAAGESGLLTMFDKQGKPLVLLEGHEDAGRVTVFSKAVPKVVIMSNEGNGLIVASDANSQLRGAVLGPIMSTTLPHPAGKAAPATSAEIPLTPAVPAGQSPATGESPSATDTQPPADKPAADGAGAENAAATEEATPNR